MKYRVDILSANWDSERREAKAEFTDMTDACFFVHAKHKGTTVSFCAYRIVDTVSGKEYRVTEDGQINSLKEITRRPALSADKEIISVTSSDADE